MKGHFTLDFVLKHINCTRNKVIEYTPSSAGVPFPDPDRQSAGRRCEGPAAEQEDVPSEDDVLSCEGNWCVLPHPVAESVGAVAPSDVGAGPLGNMAEPVPVAAPGSTGAVPSSAGSPSNSGEEPRQARLWHSSAQGCGGAP